MKDRLLEKDDINPKLMAKETSLPGILAMKPRKNLGELQGPEKTFLAISFFSMALHQATEPFMAITLIVSSRRCYLSSSRRPDPKGKQW